MQVFNVTYEPLMFDASCGLLLRDELHHSFDRLEWSLYYKVSQPGLRSETPSIGFFSTLR
jgi:hypothetical protein